jgi:NAD(P)-dependent dehydrogenase (short-subunit alcohol dehydrogenase family)
MSARAWVIGGRQGIGREITLELESHGCFVMPSAPNDVDVRSTRQLQYAFETFHPEWIVYCAGINKIMPARIFDEFEALDILDINALGFMRVMNIAAAAKPKDRPRSVVAIVSDAATRPMRNSMAYCASKAALAMAIRCAARELAPDIRVNGISPGVVEDTPMSNAIDLAVREANGWSEEEAKSYELSRIPMGRRALKSEVAAMVYGVLAGPQYLTGSIIEIAGGR